MSSEHVSNLMFGVIIIIVDEYNFFLMIACS